MLRKIVKSVSWRVIGTAELFAIAYFTTGHVETAGSVAGLSAICSFVLYVGHEFLWESFKGVET